MSESWLYTMTRGYRAACIEYGTFLDGQALRSTRGGGPLSWAPRGQVYVVPLRPEHNSINLPPLISDAGDRFAPLPAAMLRAAERRRRAAIEDGRAMERNGKDLCAVEQNHRGQWSRAPVSRSG